MIGKLLAAALAFTVTSALADPLKIRADWAVVPGTTAPLMPLAPKYAPDLYRHYGQSYVVEPLRIAGGATALSALAAGETDISTFTPQVLALGVIEAKLDLRVIGQQLSTEVPGYAGTSFWVRKAEVARLEDLKGRTVGLNARGSTNDAALRIVLDRRNMQDGKDYQIVEVRYPALLPALTAKKVDAAVLILPFSLMAAKDPTLAPLFSMGEVMGPTEALLFVARADWLAKNRAAVVDFLEDNIRLRHWLLDSGKRADAVKLVAEVARQPEENFAEWVYTNKDYYVDPNALVDVNRLQKNLDDLHKMGVTKASIEVEPHTDLSYVKEAAARLR